MPEADLSRPYPAPQVTEADLDGEHFLNYGECVGRDPEIFFPKKGELGELAIFYCGLCVVRDLCLRNSLEPEPIANDGIRAALTHNNFRKLRPKARTDMRQAIKEARELQLNNMSAARRSVVKQAKRNSAAA